MAAIYYYIIATRRHEINSDYANVQFSALLDYNCHDGYKYLCKVDLYFAFSTHSIFFWIFIISLCKLHIIDEFFLNNVSSVEVCWRVTKRHMQQMQCASMQSELQVIFRIEKEYNLSTTWLWNSQFRLSKVTDMSEYVE